MTARYHRIRALQTNVLVMEFAAQMPNTTLSVVSARMAIVETHVRPYLMPVTSKIAIRVRVLYQVKDQGATSVTVRPDGMAQTALLVQVDTLDQIAAKCARVDRPILVRVTEFVQMENLARENATAILGALAMRAKFKTRV